MEAGWRVQLLGGLRAECGDRAVTRFRSQRTAAQLAYLAYYRERTHPRQVLIELLWPEDEAEAARHNLSVALNSLRDQLEFDRVSSGAVLLADRFSVGVNPDAVTTDVAEFEAAIQAAAQAETSCERVQHLTAAVGLHRGPLPPGYYES